MYLKLSFDLFKMSYSIEEQWLVKCVKVDCDDENAEIIIRKCTQSRENFAPGVACLSGFIRVNVEFQCDGKAGEKTFLVKVPSLTNGYDLCSETGFYTKETRMYEKVIPMMMEFLTSPITPKHYLTIRTEELVLEDLALSGFKMVSNNGLLNAEHVVIALETLAKFHAVSYKLHLENPSSLSEVSGETFLTAEYLKKRFSIHSASAISVLQMAGPSAGTMRRLRTLLRETSEHSVFDTSDEGLHFRVLNHGDFRSTNVLFKYDHEGGKPISAKLLDFQCSRWNSPATDVIYFLVSSAKFSVFEKHFDEILESYLGALNKMLEELGCHARYTKGQFDEDVKSLNKFCLIVLVFFVILRSRMTVENLNWGEAAVFSSDELQKIYENEGCKELFLWLRYYERIGLFEE